VAPFSFVKSVIAQIVLNCGSTPLEIGPPGPAVAVDLLLLLTRRDADDLGQMKLDALAEGLEEDIGRFEHALVHHQAAAGGRAGDKRAGARGEIAGEIVAAEFRRLDI